MTRSKNSKFGKAGVRVKYKFLEGHKAADYRFACFAHLSLLPRFCLPPGEELEELIKKVMEAQRSRRPS
jgi:hypothetical protein